MFFSKILEYIPDSGLSRFPLDVSVCVYNGRSNNSAVAELAKFRKPQHLKENTQYFMNTLYLYLSWLRRNGEERLRAGYEEMWGGWESEEIKSSVLSDPDDVSR